MNFFKRICKGALALLLAATTVLGSVTVTPTTADAAQSALTSADFLKASGRNLRNQSGIGDIVQLKGTNLGGWLIQEFWMTPTNNSSNVNCERDIYDKLTQRFGQQKMLDLVELYQSNYITESDFDTMASLGMNCIRLPFWWRNLTDASGNLYSNWYEKIDWVIAQAKARGMYVVIDFHGAPGSQNGSDHSGVDGGNNKQGASEFFWGSNATANQNLYYSLWETIARRYKDEPAVAGYDLLNEPYCTYRYNSSYSADQLHSLLWGIYDKAYDKIRAIDPNHVIIMEATWDPVDLPNPAQYGWENVMYEYHNYEYSDYDNAEGKQISSMRNKLNAIKSAAYDVPSYMGEFCYFNQTSAWDTGLQLLTEAGMNWTTWTYKVISSYGNWGLVNQNVGSVNLETASESEIRNVWGKVGESYKNTALDNVVSKYYALPAYANSLGKPEGVTRYESENAVISGGSTESQSFYSCGVGVGSMNTATAVGSVNSDWSNIKYVEYTINAEKDGMYSVTLGYNGNGANGMTILYRLDGGNNEVLTLNNNGAAWNTMNETVFQLHLTAGTHKLRISGTIAVQSNWANQDYIDVLMTSADASGNDEDLELVSYTATILDPADATDAWTRLEAEDAAIVSANVEEQSFYSNGKGVGSLNSGKAIADIKADWSNLPHVEFNATVPAAGTYYMLIRYNGDDDKTILVKTAKSYLKVSVPAARSDHKWDEVHTAVVPVELKDGYNTISVSGTILNISEWMNLDCIDLSKTPVTMSGDKARYEAEYGVIKANRDVSPEEQGFYSNGWGAGGLGSNVNFADVKSDLSNIFYIKFPVYAQEAGQYDVTLAYNGNGAVMTAGSKVNDGSLNALTLDNSGKSWNNMSYAAFTADLNAGMNTVTVIGTATGSWDDWVNYDYIDVVKKAEEETEEPEPIDPPAEEKELPFRDVAKGSWYYDSVKEVYELGIMTGNSAGTLFTPDGVMTRGMIVNVLYRLDGSPKVTNKAGFKDVDAGKYYAVSVDWAVDNGIVKGYSDNTFRPDDEITREQMVIILYYYAKYLGMDVSKTADLSGYKDSAKVHSYAAAPVKWAVAEGIMSGSSSKQLNPLQSVTRAQAAKMLAEFNHLKVAAGK